MKKIFSTVFMTVMVCGFMACNNSKGASTEQTGNEMTDVEMAVETLEVDSLGVDTVAVETRGNSESEGFGRCLESGCYCKAFKGRKDTCQNCGHAYRRHY